MSIEVKVNVDFDGIKKQINTQLHNALEIAILSEIAVLKNRILSGTDTRGSNVAAYAPYSRSYSRRRQSRGRPINKVDWSFTGSFIRSITHEVKTTSKAIIARIFPKGKENILSGLVANRPNHWGLMEKQKVRLISSIRNNINL